MIQESWITNKYWGKICLDYKQSTNSSSPLICNSQPDLPVNSGQTLSWPAIFMIRKPWIWCLSRDGSAPPHPSEVSLFEVRVSTRTSNIRAKTGGFGRSAPGIIDLPRTGEVVHRSGYSTFFSQAFSTNCGKTRPFAVPKTEIKKNWQVCYNQQIETS